MEMISVIMPVYKEKLNILRQSLESILTQTYQNIEFIIIVDNPLYTNAIKYLKEIEQRNNNVSISINSKNMGIVYSLNKGIKLCHGEYIARMDADDISVPSRLSLELEYLKKNNYDLIGSFYYDIDSYNVKKRKVELPVTFKEIKRRLKYTNCLCHPTWLAKKEVFKNLKGYRNISSCEDYDFLVRLCLKGYSCGNIPEFLLNYRFDNDGISNKNYLQQKVIACLISKEYRKKRIVNYQYFQNYIQSKQYQIDLKEWKKIIEIKDKYKKEKTIKKLLLLCKLMLNPRFVKDKFLYFMYGK